MCKVVLSAGRESLTTARLIKMNQEFDRKNELSMHINHTIYITGDRQQTLATAESVTHQNC